MASARLFGQSVDEASRESLIDFCHTDSVLQQFPELVTFAADFDAIFSTATTTKSTVSLVEQVLLAASAEIPDRSAIKISFPQSIRSALAGEPPANADASPTATNNSNAVDSTPTKAMKSVSSFIFRTPEKMKTEEKRKSTNLVVCQCWFAVLLAIRHFAILFLREMADLHNIITWTTRYWKWAQWNPGWHCTHVMASAPTYTLRWLGGDRARLSAERRATIQRHLSRLRLLEKRVVENIGRVHGGLQSMTSMIRSLSSILEHCNDDAASDSDTREDFSERAQIDLEDELRAIATQAMQNMKFSHETGFSMLWGSERDLMALQRESSNTLMPEETVQLSGKTSWREAMATLRRIAQSSSRWVQNSNNSIRSKEFPPRGRHWPRALKYAMVAIPLMRFLSKNSIVSLPEQIRSITNLCYDRIDTYIIIPSRNLFDALVTSSRPTESYKEQLDMEVETLAKMIRDYHDDIYEGMTPSELDDISDKVSSDNDLGMVTRHYRSAMRRPISSFFFGHLVRLMLIQIQHQKIEMNRVLISSDEVLVQNDLSFKMMSLTPMVFLTLFGLWIVVLRRKTESEPVYERIRTCWRNLFRLISFVDNDEHRLRGTSRSSTISLSHADQGYVLLFVHEMRALGTTLTRYHRLAEFYEDLDDVENLNASKQQRIAVLQRMVQVHPFLHPSFK